MKIMGYSDIDSDFAPEVRGKVLDYVKHKYGEEAVCCICTMGTQGPKNAIRNCARLLGDRKYGNPKALIGLGADTAEAGALGVAGHGVGVLVLGESAHLGGTLHAVVGDDQRDHQGVGHAVGQVVESTQLVGHRVADAEEGVGKGHTCHRSGISHLFTCFYIGLTVIVCTGQILKDILKSLESKTVGIVGSEHCSVSFYSVCYSVDTGSSG